MNAGVIPVTMGGDGSISSAATCLSLQLSPSTPIITAR